MISLTSDLEYLASVYYQSIIRNFFMLFSSWDTPSDACFNSMCNTNSLYNYIVIMFCICVIMHYIIDSDIFHCIE